MRIEVAADPYSIATSSLGEQNYFINLILGAVFERVPSLRFGIMELGGHWIGPLAENMDVWVEKLFSRRYRGVLSMKPSEYVQRNIRVTPFNFKPVGDTSSDSLSFRGGSLLLQAIRIIKALQSTIQVMAERLQPLGRDVAEKFFVTNATLVMPN